LTDDAAGAGGVTSLFVLLHDAEADLDAVWQGMHSRVASDLYSDGGLHHSIAKLQHERRDLLEEHRTALEASIVTEAHSKEPSEHMRRFLIFEALLQEKDGKIAELEVTPSPRKVAAEAAAAARGGATPSRAGSTESDDSDENDDGAAASGRSARGGGDGRLGGGKAAGKQKAAAGGVRAQPTFDSDEDEMEL
jgi:hypothetical protein